MGEFFWTVLYRIAIFLANVLPRFLLLELARLLSFVWCSISYKDRIIVQENIRKVKGKVSLAICYKVFNNFAFYLVDFFRLHRLDENFIKENVKIYNRDVLDKAYQYERGVVAITAHLGNWELGGAVFAKLGYPFVVIASTHRVNYIDRFFRTQREKAGIKVLPIKNSFLISLAKLKEKNCLAILGDRDFSRQAEKVKFFNKMTPLPHSPVLLSIRAEAPIIFGFSLIKGKSYEIYLEGPIFPPDSNLSFKEKKDFLFQTMIKKLEQYIYNYVDQWFMFQPFWELPSIEAVI